MSEPQQRKRKRQPKQMRDQQNHQRQQQMLPPAQLQNDLMQYQAWLAEQLQYTAYLQQNGPLAQYLRQPNQPNPQSFGVPNQTNPQNFGVPNQPNPQNFAVSNQPNPQNFGGPNQRNRQNFGRPNQPKHQNFGRPNQQNAARKAQPNNTAAAKNQRTVATWTCYEPDGPPRAYFSDKRWKFQLRSIATLPDQCPKIFRGRTMTAWAPAIPPQPETRYCDDCGGMVINEALHKRSRLHRESLEMDVSLICSRIRRDPAFAAAVIAAARQCVENTGIEESAHDDSSEDGEGLRAKRAKTSDDFEFLEGDVFRPADKN